MNKAILSLNNIICVAMWSLVSYRILSEIQELFCYGVLVFTTVSLHC